MFSDVFDNIDNFLTEKRIQTSSSFELGNVYFYRDRIDSQENCLFMLLGTPFRTRNDNTLITSLELVNHWFYDDKLAASLYPRLLDDLRLDTPELDPVIDVWQTSLTGFDVRVSQRDFQKTDFDAVYNANISARVLQEHDFDTNVSTTYRDGLSDIEYKFRIISTDFLHAARMLPGYMRYEPIQNIHSDTVYSDYKIIEPTNTRRY